MSRKLTIGLRQKSETEEQEGKVSRAEAVAVCRPICSLHSVDPRKPLT